MVDVTVRRATIEDQAEIGRFLNSAYGDRARFKFPQRWSWEFVTNPFRHGDGLPIWLAEVDGRIVGQVCTMEVPIKIGDAIHPAAWGVDYIVLPPYRRMGIGQRMLETLLRDEDVFVIMAVSMASITRSMLESRGFQEGNTVVRFRKAIRFIPDSGSGTDGAESREVGSISSARAYLQWVLASGRGLAAYSRRWLESRQKPTGMRLTVESVERFDDEFDHLWYRLAPTFAAIVPRHAEYLNWKFVEQPHVEYQKLGAWRGDRLLGFIVVRRPTAPESNVGIIADLFASPEDEAVLDTLLAHAVRGLRHAGVASIIAATSVPAYMRHFLRWGFRQVGQQIPLYRFQQSGCPQLQEWFLSMGDHDWDQYPLM